MMVVMCPNSMAMSFSIEPNSTFGAVPYSVNNPINESIVLHFIKFLYCGLNE